MAKKNNVGAKAPQTKKAPKAPQPKSTTATPAPSPETVTAEEVNESDMKKKLAEVKIGDIATQKNSAGLDANHRVELNGQIMDMFFRNPDARNKFGDKVVDAMTDIAAIGIITAVADETVNGNSTFALTIKKTAYNQLIEAGKCIGVELPAIDKLLPGKTDDTVTLPGTSVNVSQESAEALVEEKKTQEAGDKGEIELDPVKVAHMDEEALKKALSYLMITGPKSKTLAETFTNTVDFMRDYRMELARQAENSTDAMNKYDDRSMREWMMDIFSFVEPTFWLKGIGVGLYTAVKAYKSPLRAFLILRKALVDKKTKTPVWDDQSIADTVAALVETIANNNIAAEKKALAALDKNARGYRDVATKHEEQIANNEAVISYLHDITFDIVETFDDDNVVNVVEWCEEYKKDVTKTSLIFDIIQQYYPDCAHTPAHYIGLNDNTKQQAGMILNLFRSDDNQNSEYSSANLVEIETVDLAEAKKKFAEGTLEESAIPYCYRHLFVKEEKEEKGSKKD